MAEVGEVVLVKVTAEGQPVKDVAVRANGKIRMPGADGIAVVSAIIRAEKVRKTTRELLSSIREVKK